MKNIIPRVAAIHDLSGFGRCSLTVVIPVLSSMGIQVCPIPTAVLSTHSGGFGEFHFRDLTDDMADYASHWKRIGIEFDCVYSGFLGSAKQIDIVSDIFRGFKGSERQLIVVDPVMGDHGRLYKTYTPEMQNRMRMLVEAADIITPNLTEAFFLLEETYSDEPMSMEEAKSFLKRLSEMGPETVVITSIKTQDGLHVNAGYSRSQDTYWRTPYDYIPVQYPGTGDIYTSVLTGSLLHGDNLPEAMDRATRFVSMAVSTTHSYGTPVREGVILEKLLMNLKNKQSDSNYEIIL